MKHFALLAGLLALFVALPALAHSELIDSQPAPGAQLSEPPAEIRLTFNESAGAQSQILLMADGFQPVAGITAHVDSARPEQVFASLPPLEPGNYTVQWTAVSEDGHGISGSYSFSIGAAATESRGMFTVLTDRWPWLLALLVLVVGAPLMLKAVSRQRR
jgi:methionine-rich copper-binding protein CopC